MVKKKIEHLDDDVTEQDVVMENHHQHSDKLMMENQVKSRTRTTTTITSNEECIPYQDPFSIEQQEHDDGDENIVIPSEHVNSSIKSTSNDDEPSSSLQGGGMNADEEKTSMDIPDGMSRRQRFVHHLKLGKSELIQVLKLCWPAVVMNVCFQLLGLESLSFIGHIKLEDNEIPGVMKDKVGELYMAAASLGNSFFFCLGFVAVGFIHGQDTLVSQAVGAKNFIRAGQVLARSLFTILLAMVPICVILCFANYSLLWMNQEQVLVDLVGQYLRVLTPGMIPFVICESLSLYLIAQNILLPNVIIWIISVFINFGLNWLLVFGIGFESLGFIGAPIALSITRYIMLVMYIITIYFKGYMKETWKGFTDFKAIFKWTGFKEYLKLAIPGSVMLAAEVWGFELSTITSSFLGATALASHSIVLNICALTFMVPLSLATATSIKIGQYMGSREPFKAKYTAYSSMIFSGFFMFCSGSTLAICREWIPQIYTQDPDIIYNASIIFPLCAIFQLFDGIQAILGGAVRGVGKQIIGAASTLVAYYIIGLPIGAVLAFVAGWGLVGIWTGLAIALFSVFVGLLIYVRFRIDWVKEADIAYARAVATAEKTPTESSTTLESPTTILTGEEMNTQVELEEGTSSSGKVITVIHHRQHHEENKATSSVSTMDDEESNQQNISFGTSAPLEDDMQSSMMEEDEDYSRVNSRVNLLSNSNSLDEVGVLEDEE